MTVEIIMCTLDSKLDIEPNRMVGIERRIAAFGRARERAYHSGTLVSNSNRKIFRLRDKRAPIKRSNWTAIDAIRLGIFAATAAADDFGDRNEAISSISSPYNAHGPGQSTNSRVSRFAWAFTACNLRIGMFAQKPRYTKTKKFHPSLMWRKDPNFSRRAKTKQENPRCCSEARGSKKPIPTGAWNWPEDRMVLRCIPEGTKSSQNTGAENWLYFNTPRVRYFARVPLLCLWMRSKIILKYCFSNDLELP